MLSNLISLQIKISNLDINILLIFKFLKIKLKNYYKYDYFQNCYILL